MPKNEELLVDESQIESMGYDNEEDQQEHKLYPIDRDKVQVVVNNWTIFNIVEYIKRRKIDLQPVFQRSYVRHNDKAEKLIDSIRNWLPIPQIFLLTKEDWTSLVIDGQQRLTSLIRFCLPKEILLDLLPLETYLAWFKTEDEVKLKVSKSIFTWLEEDEKIQIYFEDLENKDKDKFEWESLIVWQIRPNYSILREKVDALNELSKEIFHRLNTWWVKLTDQEIRQSLYHGPFMQELRKISFSNNWRNLIPMGTQKFINDPSLLTEMLLRAFSLLDVFAEEKAFDSIGKIKDKEWNKFSYIKPLGEFLDRYSSFTETFNAQYCQDRLDILNKLIPILNTMFLDESLFKHNNQLRDESTWNNLLPLSFNVKYIDTLFVWLLNLFRFKQDVSVADLRGKIDEFKGNIDFIKNNICKWGSTDPKYVEARVKESISFFMTLSEQNG